MYTSVSTYDPLSGINAYRNLHLLGMEVDEYREGYTGDFGGFLNRVDVPCDRFFISWDLKGTVEKPEYDLDSLLESGNDVLSTEIVAVEGRKGQIRLEVIKDVNMSLEHEILLVEIPYDYFWMLRETDVPDDEVRNIPLDWRMKTREIFQSLFKNGYKVIDLIRFEQQKRTRNLYVIKKI